jgi:hypothetical protein
MNNHNQASCVRFAYSIASTGACAKSMDGMMIRGAELDQMAVVDSVVVRLGEDREEGRWWW